MKVVFLDRDGTIIENIGYCSRPEDINILPTVPEAIKLLNENGFKVIIITNQSGIGRGHFTEEDLAKVHKKLVDDLSEQNAIIDAIYYCPHHPKDNCECRKPKTALFKKAIKEFNINVKKSFVIGDSRCDIEAGKHIWCRTILLGNKIVGENGNIISDYFSNSFIGGIRWILSQK